MGFRASPKKNRMKMAIQWYYEIGQPYENKNKVIRVEE